MRLHEDWWRNEPQCFALNRTVKGKYLLYQSAEVDGIKLKKYMRIFHIYFTNDAIYSLSKAHGLQATKKEIVEI